jgi:photosystem II stability/assembly factor-like uncharacterized protein
MKKYYLCIVIAFSFIQGINAQWTQQVSGSSQYLSSISFPTALVGYVSDINGNLLKTTNGGANWNFVSGVGNVYGSYFTSVDTGYASYMTGLRTIDGGITWSPSASGAYFYFLTHSIAYSVGTNAAADSAIIYKTTNAGNSWIVTGKFATFGIITSIFFIDINHGFIVSNGEGLFKTTDGGVSWVSVSSDIGLNDVYFPSSSIGYLAGTPDLYKSTDGGNTWNTLTNPNPTLFYSIYFLDNNNGYAAGGDGFSTGEIIKTADGGTTWTLSLTNSYTYNALDFPTASLGYACGSGGAIFKLATATGIESYAQSSQLNIYPNPSSGIFTIQLRGEQKNAIISICDVLGNEVIEKKSIANLENYKIDISEQPKGVYFVKVESEEGVAIQKIVYQ